MSQDGAGDGGEYLGVLDEWAQEQAQQRGRDQARDRWDNEERGVTGMPETEEEARGVWSRIAPLVDRTRRTRLEADLTELMVQTRRDLALALLVAREHASHPYIARLERENAALREIAQELITAADATGVEMRPYAGPGHSRIIGPFPNALEKARVLLAGKGEEDGA